MKLVSIFFDSGGHYYFTSLSTGVQEVFYPLPVLWAHMPNIIQNKQVSPPTQLLSKFFLKIVKADKVTPKTIDGFNDGLRNAPCIKILRHISP